ASSHEISCQPSAVSTRYAGPVRPAPTASRQSRAIVLRPASGRASTADSIVSVTLLSLDAGRKGSGFGARIRRVPAMRTTWNGSLSFGLVSIPVGLAPATKPAARQSDVSFRLLHRECATPIKQKRWCPTHDREVSQDEIVRGFEVTKGQFVIVEDA